MNTLFQYSVFYNRYLFWMAFILWALSQFLGKGLPDPKEIRAELLKPPIQTQTDRFPFIQYYQDNKYTIIPKFNYEISGLVVSQRDLEDTWWNINFDRDPLNIKDVCVIWGGNLVSDDYKKIKFESGLWTCFASFKGNVHLSENAISNNHILPADSYVARELDHIQIGDQIYIKGWLVDYHVNKNSSYRQTSTTREDKGNGACEVIFADQIEILEKGNPFWNFMRILSYFLGAWWACVYIIENMIKPYMGIK